jgi:hypothetical protein
MPGLGLLLIFLAGLWTLGSMITGIGTTKPTRGKRMKALKDPDLSADQKQFLNEIQGVRYVVINKQHGGFGLSQAAIERYLEIKGLVHWAEDNERFSSLTGPTYWLVPKEQRVSDPTAEVWHSMTIAERQQHNQLYSQQVFSDRDLDRDDPILVQVVQELGSEASGRFADLKVVEIPVDVDWIIDEYDGLEWVAEKHRTWS